ncbi:MAG TPA: YciI family protein [Polyangia bacterium]
MMMIKSDARAEAGTPPDGKLLAAMGKFNEEMTNAGVMLEGEGLQASARGALVRLTEKKLTVIDGPFSNVKGLIAGFWLLQVPSRADAIAWAKRVPIEEGEVELRALWEMADFAVAPEEKEGGWRDQETHFREVAATAATAPETAAALRKPGTTRFMVMLRSDPATESGAPPTTEALERMGALMTELAMSGAMLSGEGLKPSATGARVKSAAGKRTVLDGPFSETKELIAGYTMIQVPSLADAVAFAKRWLPIHVEAAPSCTEGEIEIRPLFELSDFPVGAT